MDKFGCNKLKKQGERTHSPIMFIADIITRSVEFRVI
jgi:hypothetical protein